jgi:DnaD/phage-associated family protein
MTDVWDLPLVANRKLILLSLADNASDNGRCWPSQNTIARRSAISVRHLRDHLHALVADGWLTVLSLGNGRGNSTEYLLNVERIKADATNARKAAKADADDIKADSVTIKADAASRPTVIEPSVLQPSSSTDARAGAVFRAIEDLTGSLTKPVADAINAELDSGRDPDWMLAAVEVAALANARRWDYADGILRHWDEHGFRCDCGKWGHRASNGTHRAGGARGGGEKPKVARGARRPGDRF